MNNKSDETTPLTKDIPVEEGSNGGNATAAPATTENNAPLNNETSGLEEKLSALEKDAEAGGAGGGGTNSSSKRKSITAAIIAAEDLLENPKIRLILGIVGAVLLFLFVLVLAIVIIVSESVNWNFLIKNLIKTLINSFITTRTTTPPTASFASCPGLEARTI